MVEPITVTEAAEFLKLDTSSSPIPEQALVSSIIVAARKAAEHFMNRTVVERSRVETYDSFSTVISLLNGDVTSIDEIQYIDTDGVSQTITDDEWVLSKNRLTAAYGATWPSTREQLGAVQITYTAGYPEGTVPEPIVQAMYMMVGDMYDNREAVSQAGDYKINPTVENLLYPYRIDLGQ